MLHRSTIQLLRLHFSFFLLPVYLFAVSQVYDINWVNAALVFVILHFLVYPASNGYNSYMDRDKTPIGGLLNPMQPTKQLFYVTIFLDVFAVLVSAFISTIFAMGILLYILASRAYSYRGIRLKQYPIIGFLTVFILQGVVIFYIVFHAVHQDMVTSAPLLPGIASSFLIGALYPLTQVYQHDEDRKDGVITISALLGKKGSFLLSMLFFICAAVLLFIWFQKKNEINFFYLFLFVTIPVVFFFLKWMRKVWLNEKSANYKNSLLMNIIATICTVTYFLMLIIINH